MITSKLHVTTRSCGICLHFDCIPELLYSIVLNQKGRVPINSQNWLYIVSLYCWCKDLVTILAFSLLKFHYETKDEETKILISGWWLMFLSYLSCPINAYNFWLFLCWIAKCWNQKVFNFHICCSDSKFKKIPFLFFRLFYTITG